MKSEHSSQLSERIQLTIKITSITLRDRSLFKSPRTNEHSLRLIKIVKARGVDFTDNYYGLNWNAEQYKLEMLGVIKDWKKFILDDNKKYLWKKALEQMPKAFITNDWVKEVVNDLNIVKERQAKKWLREIELLGMIKKIKHGHWEKTSLEFVEDIIELE